jgi:hypothetical protein
MEVAVKDWVYDDLQLPHGYMALRCAGVIYCFRRQRESVPCDTGVHDFMCRNGWGRKQRVFPVTNSYTKRRS